MAQTLPDPNLIYSVPIQTYLVNKDTGAPLSAGVVTFYKDTDRTALKSIYQVTEDTPNNFAYVELNNPITLTSVGTFADDNGADINVFLYPYEGTPFDAVRGAPELYYVAVDSSTGVRQETRSAWPPNVQADSGGGTAGTFGISSNQITNEQFIEILGTGSVTYDVTGVGTSTEIAPGWFALTSGVGVITVSQIDVADTANTLGTNAPYALQILSTAPDGLSLYQRLDASPFLLAGNYVYGSVLVAAVAGGGAQSITLQYEPSSGSDAIFATTSTTADEQFTQIAGTVLTVKDNTTTAPDGYVDFVINLHPNVTFQITSAQMMGVSADADFVAFPQGSANQQTNQLYWYDKPHLEYKPIPSYLVGWDFPLNPCQALGVNVAAQAVGANRAYYVADQTILFQTVNSALTMANTKTQMNITAAAATSFAMIQYLDGNQVSQLLDGVASVQILATKSGTAVTGRVDLCWTDGATIDVLPLSVVASITAGVPTLAGGWNFVPTKHGTASFTPTSTATPYNYNGFDASAVDTSAATFFAIVVTFDTLAITETIGFQYISLMKGEIATRPAPKTVNETLLDCQYYYEKSYDIGVVPGAAVVGGALMAAQTVVQWTGSSAAYNVYPAGFGFQYKAFKRSSNPIVEFYSTLSGTIGTLQTILFSNGGVVGAGERLTNGNWSFASKGESSVTLDLANATPLLNPAVNPVVAPSAYIRFQYSIDARLGLVV